MKMSKLFTITAIPLVLLGLYACLGRGHNLRKLSSVETKPVGSQVEAERAPASITYIEGIERVVIGNYFDITQGSQTKLKDDSSGFIQEGNWFQDKLKGSQNSISRFTNDPSARAIYVTDALGDSTYCLWVYRVTSKDATTSAQVDIFDGAEQIGIASFSLAADESMRGWFPLGEYSFTHGQESRVIISKSVEDESILRADEVKFEKIDESHDCQGLVYTPLDDSATILPKEVNPKTFAGVDGYREYGDWENSTLVGFNSNRVRMSEDEYAYVSYNFLPTRTSYCLEVYRVINSDALSNVKVSVFQEDTEVFSSYINYKPEKEGKVATGWFSLGKLNFEEAKMISVIFEREPLDIGLMLSDAVRLYSSDKCR